ncbi:hypothetical protein FIBSPDRAFT_943158 [Athelia psychrophila]|uniref:Uncharacterized protein n=1 Tax=Athelia psychrophila TaxID=1759441 RepID=A0A166WTM9_9AGAM|nr:hypothetical protein FIBSPDRAFT_943158 [Fibularhizoctonia sp. CBS 109695]
MKETLPDLLVPLTRLAELSQTPITVILLSEQDGRISNHNDVAALSKEVVLSRLMLSFRRSSFSASADDNPYNLALLPICTHFASPAIDDRRLNDQEQRESGVDIEPALAPPSEDMRMRFTRLFTPTFTTALETLYPRLNDATLWARDSAPVPNLLELPAAASISPRKPGAETIMVVPDVLPRMSKFILVAAVLASTNARGV